MQARGAASLVLLSVLGAPSLASAAPQDVEATRVGSSAISQEYMSGKFTLAQQKLEKAIKICKQGKCSGRVLSRLYRDLGVVYLGGLNKKKAGKQALALAVQTDPSVQLNPDLTTPEIAAAFEEAGGVPRGKAKPAQAAEAEAAEPPQKVQKPEKAQKSEKPAKSLKGAQPAAEEIELEEEPDTSSNTADEETAEEPDVPGSARKNWFSLGLQQDFLHHGATSKVCGGPEYTCFGPDDVEYTGNVDPDKGNQTDGGFGVATTRILLGYDRLLTDQILAGARLGFAFGGSPASSKGKFLPLHLELRGGYYFGAKPFSRDGWRPFAGIAAGIAQVDSSIAVDYFDGGNAGTLDAWRKSGKGFAAVNAGTQFALNRVSAISAEARLMLMLGASGVAPALGISYVHGL